MSKHISFKRIFTVLVMLTAVIFFGCEKKTDTNEQPTDGAEPEILVEDTTPGKGNTEVEQEKEIKTIIQDLKGTWTGTFDKRSTVLNITEQTDSSFSGKISIKYRETINQDVKGTFRPATQKVLMEDQIHSKYMGKYDGKLSDDGKNLSGIFTMNRDGTKSTFNLNKN